MLLALTPLPLLPLFLTDDAPTRLLAALALAGAAAQHFMQGRARAAAQRML